MIRYLQRIAHSLHAEPHRLLVGCFVLILAGCTKSPDDVGNTAGVGQNENKTTASLPTNSMSALVQLPRSVFSTNVDEGRDPFFPESTRRLPKVAGTVPSAARSVQPPSNFLKLTGLWPSKSRPLALINTTTIGPGEEANITVLVSNGQSRAESHKLLVRCLKVRHNSVLISIDGEPGTKELVLQSRL